MADQYYYNYATMSQQQQQIRQNDAYSSVNQNYGQNILYQERAANNYARAQPQTQPQLQQQSFLDYLRSFPMFPLYTEKEAAAKQKVLETSAQLLGQRQPEPQLNAIEKVSLGLMDATTGGVTNKTKMDNNLLGLAAGSTAGLATDIMTVVLTRWAYVPDSSGRDTRGIVFADVLQCKSAASWAMNNNPAYVKAASSGIESLSLKVLGKDAKIKGNKMWSKKLTTKTVQEVTLVKNKGSEMRMEALLSVQRMMSPVEWAEVNKRFEFGWQVPSV